jgi:hypothetical protein
VMLRHKRFPIQAEESTGYNGSGYLVAWVRYVESATINEDVIFCKWILQNCGRVHERKTHKMVRPRWIMHRCRSRLPLIQLTYQLNIQYHSISGTHKRSLPSTPTPPST